MHCGHCTRALKRRGTGTQRIESITHHTLTFPLYSALQCYLQRSALAVEPYPLEELSEHVHLLVFPFYINNP